MMIQIPPVISDDDVKYNLYHRKRVDFALQIINIFHGRGSHILEVGPWTIANTLRTHEPEMIVDSLGYNYPEIILRKQDRHIAFNLSTMAEYSRGETKRDALYWPTIRAGGYDMVVACEVIEHLPVNMGTIMAFLKSYTVVGGHVLIQTPNGVSLKRRLAMLSGKNPFDHIIETNNHTHQHIREYTMKELVEYAEDSGLKVVAKWCENYFSYTHSWKARLYNAVVRCLPEQFRDGITLLLTREA